jgi:hypothetical protein
MPIALTVIAIIYGLCLMGDALNNMPSPGAFIVLCIIAWIAFKISDAISEHKKKKKEV